MNKVKLFGVKATLHRRRHACLARRTYNAIPSINQSMPDLQTTPLGSKLTAES
ncbi:hypothetical protein NH514_03045 [Pseudoalteromonas sp. ACER1]|uniref:hypothetical protein n=1 Tax=unclassified Pseudoalteromonas TaxID=194690 RepID=UPI001F2F67E3|nr:MULTISPECIES: hypothetical protein [unclassified Pseudoalteromonas]MCF2848699.1 hypothetical protein [Pseudoalteromonas sp. PAST1]MCO7209710.1 hypothetical protein [Pseudoalteromonas sp. ACER1]